MTVERNRFPEIAAHMDEALQRALEDTAEYIVAAARARVPYDTGALSRAIREEKIIGGANPARMVIAGNDEAFYGHMVRAWNDAYRAASLLGSCG